MLTLRSCMKCSVRYLLSEASSFKLQQQQLDSVKNLRVRLAEHVSVLKERGATESHAVDGSLLEGRSMRESHDQVTIPLRHDPQLRLKYLNLRGAVRFGMLLEDLDTFAVWLSYRHNQGQQAHGLSPSHHPMCIVTACVDKIDMRGTNVNAEDDIVLEGHISHTGRSSLEATMQMLQQQKQGDWRQIVEARFVMVARHPVTGRAVPVHPLAIDEQHQETIFELGEANKKQRQRQAEESLLRTAPTETERNILHQLFLMTIDDETHSFQRRTLPPNYVWMEEGKLKNVIVCFPEQRNLYNKIFGGYLMRQAFELAWANAALFCRGHPRVLAVDDIMFRKSVDIGSLLFLSSQVCYTKDKSMQIRVHAEVVGVEDNSHKTTNTFHFTFSAEKAVKSIMPKTYADGILYLNEKRHFEEATKNK